MYSLLWMQCQDCSLLKPPNVLHVLLILDSQVLVFQVSSANAQALSKGDSIGTLLLVPRATHQVETQSERAQPKPLQSVWAITSSQATRPGVILAEGAGVTT